MNLLGERNKEIYQGISEYKLDAQASESIMAITRLRVVIVLVKTHLSLGFSSARRSASASFPACLLAQRAGRVLLPTGSLYYCLSVLISLGFFLTERLLIAQAPTSVNQPQFTAIGVKECAACHSNPSPIHQRLGITSFVRMVEAREWLNHDRHALAYKYVDPKHNELTRKICEKLGWSPSGDEFVSQCLTCHAGVDHRAKRPSESVLQYGVQCESCHGAGSQLTRVEHHQQVNWRAKTPAQKKALGMNDLRSPKDSAEICFSCHIGEIDQNRFVTHAMYAAGHPPLPPVDFQSLLDAMPPHWKSLAEKPVPAIDGQPSPQRFELQDEYFAANFGDKYKMPVGQMAIRQSYRRTQASLIGGQVAQQVAIELLRDAASRENLWGDYALYDCNACHHELQRPSQRRQAAGRIPGRPFPMAWWLAELPTEALENRLPGPRIMAINDVFNAKPFGQRMQVLEAMNEFVVESPTSAERSRIMTGAQVRQWVQQLITLRDDDIHDYWTAKQTGWMVTIACRELLHHKSVSREPIDRLLHELSQELDLPIAKPRNSPSAQSIFLELEKNNRFDPQRTREILRQLLPQVEQNLQSERLDAQTIR